MATNNSTPHTTEIPLTQGQFAIVDKQDADLTLVKWCAQYNTVNNSYYAIRTIGGRDDRKRIMLHNVIMERVIGTPVPELYEVDHINRNTLDNRRENLRLATYAQNCQNKGINRANKSGFKGVSFNKSKNCWIAVIFVNRKAIHLGHYDKIIDAAVAYNQGALKYFGEFAYLNPIEGWEQIVPVKRTRASSHYSDHPTIEYYENKKNKWRARFHVDGRSMSLGYFATKELACAAWYSAAKKYRN